MKHVRFTVSCEPEVHEAFKQMAELSGTSLSSTVGAWMKDTTEAALFVNQRMRDLRMAPAQALLELAKVQERAAADTREKAEAIASGRLRLAEESGSAPQPGAAPPSSLTGTNSRKAGKR